MILKFPKTKQLTHNELNEYEQNHYCLFLVPNKIFDLLLILVGVETANSSGLTPNGLNSLKLGNIARWEPAIYFSVFDDTTFYRP